MKPTVQAEFLLAQCIPTSWLNYSSSRSGVSQLYHCVLATQVKNIELAAQGGKAVVYTARLVGQKDFSLEASTIRVEPGTTASFAVHFKASTTNPQVPLLLSLASSGALQHHTACCTGPVPVWQFKGWAAVPLATSVLCSCNLTFGGAV